MASEVSRRPVCVADVLALVRDAHSVAACDRRQARAPAQRAKTVRDTILVDQRLLVRPDCDGWRGRGPRHGRRLRGGCWRGVRVWGGGWLFGGAGAGRGGRLPPPRPAHPPRRG